MRRLAEIPVNRYLDFALFLALGLFPLFGSLFYTQLLEKYLVFLIFAFSLDLVWGYAGLMDLGHAVLFGLGGYTMALSLSAQEGVPEFMARYGVKQVPLWLQWIVPQPAAVLVCILLPALLAGLLGRFLFYSRVGGVFFSVITLAARIYRRIQRDRRTSGSVPFRTFAFFGGRILFCFSDGAARLYFLPGTHDLALWAGSARNPRKRNTVGIPRIRPGAF